LEPVVHKKRIWEGRGFDGNAPEISTYPLPSPLCPQDIEGLMGPETGS
jgi:hypothetical protein